MPKKIKVTITKKVNSFRYGDEVFKPGDTLEILPQYFRADFMVKFVPPEEKPQITEEIVEETPEIPTEVPRIGESEAERKKKERRR